MCAVTMPPDRRGWNSYACCLHNSASPLSLFSFLPLPRFLAVGHTLRRASGDLVNFATIYILVNTVYMWITSSLFGRRVESFATLPLAFFALARWFLGDFGAFDAIQAEFLPLDLGPNVQLMAWLTFLSFIVINTVLLQNVVLSIVVDAFMDQKEAAARESDLRDDLVMCCFATRCGVDYLGGDFRAGGCLACCCAKCRQTKQNGFGWKRRFSRIPRVVVDDSELAATHAARELHALGTLERAKSTSMSRGSFMSSEQRARKKRRKTWAAAVTGVAVGKGGVLNSAATSIRMPKLATIHASGPHPTKQREVFDGYDIDHSGELCMVGELPPALKDLGLDPSGDFSEFDLNGSGTISFSEYVARSLASARALACAR